MDRGGFPSMPPFTFPSLTMPLKNEILDSFSFGSESIDAYADLLGNLSSEELNSLGADFGIDMKNLGLSSGGTAVIGDNAPNSFWANFRTGMGGDFNTNMRVAYSPETSHTNIDAHYGPANLRFGLNNGDVVSTMGGLTIPLLEGLNATMGVASNPNSGTASGRLSWRPSLGTTINSSIDTEGKIGLGGGWNGVNARVSYAPREELFPGVTTGGFRGNLEVDLYDLLNLGPSSASIDRLGERLNSSNLEYRNDE